MIWCVYIELKIKLIEVNRFQEWLYLSVDGRTFQ